ncbi:MAG: DUF5134 domain-containing protein [Trebonia sp.]|jgi:hypothetical protein
MTPAWILDLLAALMLVVAAVSAARLVVARPWQHGSVIVDTDIAHLLMAIAMAGMLVSSLQTLPDTGWEVIFGVMIAWYGFRVVRDAQANGVRALAGGHCAPHLVHSGAMLYMFLAMTTATGGMAGMAGGSSSALSESDPTLAFVFALILIGYSIWDLDQLSGRRYSLASARVSLAEVRAGVPAMAGAQSAANTAFSGPIPTDADLEAITDTATGSGTVGGHAVACDTTAIAGGNAAAGAFGEFLLSPAVTVGCRVTMGVVMAFMLLIAI